ncbi:MAG: hypothetical protein LBM60_03790 [Clostridium sp.]|jgi:predicted RNA-binding Zn-ribbon protein involved in translation (DUF1610 family)|nr:hypothetical protein [Clostridium sp.]
MIYQCKNCGGNVVYDPKRSAPYCSYCDSKEVPEKRSYVGDPNVCQSCGGELKPGQSAIALFCPYCDNSILLENRMTGDFTPNLVIPFTHSKEMAVDLLRQLCKKKVFTPSDFLSKTKLKDLRGEYVPFWLFDFGTKIFYEGEGKKVRVWRTMDVEYTETSHYRIVRDMNIGYEKIPADASTTMQDDVMDLMEPYQYDKMASFDPIFLSGFVGDHFHMGSQEREPHANQKMRVSAEQLLKNTIAGYSSVRDIDKQIQVTDQTPYFALLPVWVYAYSYKEKSYPFYINGQTGKVVGKVPVATNKVIMYGITLYILLFLGLFLINYLINFF